MALAALVLATDMAEKVKPLTASKIWTYLGVIALACAGVILAGLGYFTPGKD